MAGGRGDSLTRSAALSAIGLTSRARGSYQAAGLNKSGSSIFGLQTANATPTNPCYCFCILGDPAERLKGIREQGGRRTCWADARLRCSFGHATHQPPSSVRDRCRL